MGLVSALMAVTLKAEQGISGIGVFLFGLGFSNQDFYLMFSLLTGIGFTMSLFIGSLAFEQGGPDYVVTDRLGILAGTAVAGLWGYLVLRLGLPERDKKI